MDLSDQGLDHRFGKTLEGKAMDDGATIFFHGADRSFDFGNVAVGGASLQRNGGDVVPDAFKFAVGVYGLDAEAAGDISSKDLSKEGQHGVLGPVVHRDGVAETEGT